MDCVTVFDVRQAAFHAWPFIYIGGPLTAVGALIAWVRRGQRGLARWLLLLLSAGVTIGVTASAAHDLVVARNAISQGQSFVLEGVVQALTPVPAGVKGLEHLRVSDHDFAYSDFLVHPGMNESERKRAGLAPGQRIRLWYRGEDILRVETCGLAAPRQPN